MRFASSRRASAEINLTPLIDILFLVLVFLVVTASFTDRTVLPLTLPQAATADTVRPPPDGVLIVIDADGVVSIDGAIHDPDGVRRVLASAPDPTGLTVTVAADERTAHGRVVQVLDLARQIGIARLDIQTFRPPAPDGPAPAH